MALYSSVPSVTSTTSPPGVLISSGRAKWLVMAWVSTASRRVRNPMSRFDSQTVLSHSIVVAPQMSLTSTWSAPCSRSMRATRASTWSGTRWSTGTAIPVPPASSTSSAVSSIVSGRFISDRCDRVVRPVT